MDISSNTQDLPAVPAARPLSAMRVLVADDNHDAADTLAELLAMDLGCQVGTAYDGRGALQRALAEQPDVLILDIRMPEFGGVDVVRELARIRREEADAQSMPPAPLFLAVTGSDVSASLADIDGCFQGAFAKPVDGQALVDLLRRHWQGDPEARRQPSELSDLLCQVARKSVPILHAQRHVLCFDYRGPSLMLDHDEGALHAGLYRLLCGAADMVSGGHTMFDASVHPDPSGAWALTVEITATGTLHETSVLSEVLARLGLVDTPGGSPGASAGTCPRSGAQLRCRVVPGVGVQLGFEVLCSPQQVIDASADARGAQAWIVDQRILPAAVLQERLLRLGWSLQRFDSLAAAREHAAQTNAPAAPQVLVVMEGPDADARELAALQAALPLGVRCIRVVAIGSAALRGRQSSPGCSVHVDPLSPGELVALTRNLHRPLQAEATSPAPRQRPRLLVVDDMEVNRLVASGLAGALGYDVALVADGLDAIRYCSQSPPDVVLMDVNMPVVGGIDATQRIRHLQRMGRIPPFPILAATANDDQATADQCRLVGMDGFLSKPLALQILGEELRRVTLNAPY